MKKKMLWFFLLFLFGLVTLNVLCFFHGYRMTHFVKDGAHPNAEKMALFEKIKLGLTGATIPKPALWKPQELTLPFQEFTIPTSDSNTLHAWKIPHPTATRQIFLFHGYAINKAFLVNEALIFYKQGLEVVLVDFRGHGKSSGYETTMGWKEAWDVQHALHFFSQAPHGKAKKPLVFGFSMGTSALLKAVSEKRIDVGGIILQSCFDSLLETTKNRFRMFGIPSFPLAHWMLFWAGKSQGLDYFQHNPVEYATKIHVPVLVTHGSLDQRILPQQAQRVFDALPCPKTWVVLEGLGHELYATKQPKKWEEIVQKFLSSIP